ncbi:MAG: histidine phosphatase family protein [Candidatus Doudnabacteria bacterium]|nr:histidine phosphatase family protein [Candidatus Doudnabacteria bacterium]
MFEKSRQDIEPKEVAKTKVILEFFRHGEKEKVDKPENEIRLTEKGRDMATNRSNEINPQPEVSIAFGSPRQRAQETAGRVLLASSEKIPSNASLEDIETFIESEIKNGKKIISDPRLDFQQDRQSEFGQKHLAAFKAGRIMDFMVNESDSLAEQLQDPEAFSYSRIAANIAKILKKYLKVGNSFEKIVERSPEKYQDYNNQLERYFGTHQTVGESFIAKLLEDTQGPETRDQYLKEVGGSGVAELQGFQVEITNEGQKQSAIIHAKTGGKQWDIVINEEILNKLISEGI